ncbi:MAG: RagB/SusD family nutrient uptake outer membrane protein, partial [Tannerella sp.]|nr:RagB/SusD family nutrient uptake outer membrane protein [Tannerella sp.]
MNYKIKNTIITAALAMSISCSEYLEVVPDNTLTLENIFAVKEEAYHALAKIYSYMPPIHDTHNSPWTMGDEFVGRLDMDGNSDNLRGLRIMRGLQSETSPLLGSWSGTMGGRKLYEGIRQTNVFIDNIDKVADMADLEKADWKAQAIFLKAYYNFLLIQQYGPIVIVDKQVSPDALAGELFQYRSKVEECYDYVIKLMNEAIPNLKERAPSMDYGTID